MADAWNTLECWMTAITDELRRPWTRFLVALSMLDGVAIGLWLAGVR